MNDDICTDFETNDRSTVGRRCAPWIAASVVVIAAFSGCDRDEEAPQDEPADQRAPQQPEEDSAGETETETETRRCDDVDDDFPCQAIAPIAAEDVEELEVDGRLDEPLWDDVASLSLRPMGEARLRRTTVDVGYTDDALVVGAYIEDDRIWSDLDERDADLWTQEVLELFLAPEGADNPYVELQINPLQAVFDAYFEARPGHSGDREADIDEGRAWDLDGLEAAVHVEGEVNDDAEDDEFWSVEMVIPFAGLPFEDGELSPEDGDIWRVNLYRFDRPDDETTDAYGWSTAPRGDFHQIDRFGHWIFDGR